MQQNATTILPQQVVLGLGANWRQFALLVAVNCFVGSMVGLERSVFPLLAEAEFGVRSATAATSFIATFGVAKAFANLAAGRLASRFSKRRLLLAGWAFGLPVPWLLVLADSWGWVVAANLLLGLNQGLTWSMTVNMKVDLVGPRRRGLALGLNEAAGYMSVAAAAYLSGEVAAAHGLRPGPLYLGIAFSAAGLALSTLVKDTTAHVRLEAAPLGAGGTSLLAAFADATWRRRQLWGASQAGLTNNLNDAVLWGIFPILCARRGFSLEEIGLLAAAYPLVWGALQPATGALADVAGRKPLVVAGMAVQAIAIWLAAGSTSFGGLLVLVSTVGIGTALVYPTLLAAVSDAAHPEDRASLLGVYRFWRDAGAIAGALLGGAIADAADLGDAMRFVALVTFAAGVVAAFTLSPAKDRAYAGGGS
ncbi:MAG TPA: MFS transporter [Dehalococcoidia bacterium]|nr:MFS transporter [Dehalococcoidia bacterium]